MGSHERHEQGVLLFFLYILGLHYTRDTNGCTGRLTHTSVTYCSNGCIRRVPHTSRVLLSHLRPAYSAHGADKPEGCAARAAFATTVSSSVAASHLPIFASVHDDSCLCGLLKVHDAAPTLLICKLGRAPARPATAFSLRFGPFSPARRSSAEPDYPIAPIASAIRQNAERCKKDTAERITRGFSVWSMTV